VGVDALLATISEGGEAPRSRRRPPPSAEPPRSTLRHDVRRRRTSVDVMVPTLGESVTEATVSTWFKARRHGRADEMLCELETDKVSVEVPAPASGTLAEILAGRRRPWRRAASSRMGAGGGASARSRRLGQAMPPRRRTRGAQPVGKDIEDAPRREKAMAEAGPLARSGARAPAATAAS
jgi:2-oxoglutarate dehydrogenase E2 component (dihydrolipoamide succinyltransferase)